MSSGVKNIIVNLDTLQTKKTHKKQTQKVRSHVEPNKLKDAFMKQVQHYKSKSANNKPISNSPTISSSSYTNDFNDSVEYLTNLKKSSENVHTELPTELLEKSQSSLVPMLILDPKPIGGYNKVEPIIQTNISNVPTNKYKVDTAVPYGCLKNGIKPSFKNWTRSNRDKNQSQETPKPMFLSEPIKSEIPMFLNNNSEQETPKPMFLSEPIKPEIPMFLNNDSEQETPKPMFLSEPIQQQPQQQLKLPLEQRTIIKRHEIGKSKKHNNVGVLIKNLNTRKQILGAYKDLKKVHINTVKTHLKNNGLLKVGTTAPNEILRQTYESSILAGDIINKNNENLYHNFINDNENK
jgi:hypothetical protein